MALWTARQIWKTLPKERRAEAALALWEGENVSREDRLVALAPWLTARGFRGSYLEQLPRPRRAALIAEGGLPEETAMQVLSAFHLAHRRPLLSRFLDLLEVPHDNGLFREGEGLDPEKLTAERLAAAAAALRAEFPPDDVDLYLRTLTAQDPVSWAALAPLAGDPA
ncbi:MAG: hypothetical protein MUF27_06600 [Acidobacteria bacterium]|nr:hypothetical protein [Acidobacteriota bacterium]